MTALAPTTIALAARIGPPVMPHCRRCPTRGPWAIVRGLVKPGTRYRALLGGGCHRSRFCNRSMGAEKGADMTHRQRNLVWSVLPRIKAHLRVGREMHGLHRYGIGLPRNVVGQHQDFIARVLGNELGGCRGKLARKRSRAQRAFLRGTIFASIALSATIGVLAGKIVEANEAFL